MSPPPPRKVLTRRRGFTLAELLISLAILGVIATFTIPKILVSQQNSQYNAMSKEVIASIAEAYQQHKLAGLLTTSTKPSDFSQYMNYLSLDTTTTIDDGIGAGAQTCNATTNKCIRLANGGLLYFADWASFSGSSNLSAAQFSFDPNGKLDPIGSPQKGNLWIFVYYNGKVTIYGNLDPGTLSTDTVRNPDPSRTPPWFSWN